MKFENNPLQNKSYDLALNIVKEGRLLINDKQELILSKQLIKSGTSVGANIIEANGAISKADFSAKISIAYKEYLESKYWLSFLKDSQLIDKEKFRESFNDADEVAKILFSNLKTTRINNND